MGGIAIQTAVTERNYSGVLKVCLGSRKLGLDTLAPLGVPSISQNNFAAYCTQPRIYNLFFHFFLLIFSASFHSP